MRRIRLAALALIFFFSAVGCTNTEPENPDAKNNRLKNLSEKNKDKGKGKGGIAEP
jgi:hypothetical protein